MFFISFALDDEARRAASYLNKDDVFNVTITRARQLQFLLVSMDETKLPIHNLFRQYIESIEDFAVAHKASSDIDSFQREVCQALQAEGIETWPGYTMIGVEIDILCRYQQTYLAIDLIGYPGPWQDYFELDSYKLFNRAGVNILPISYDLWVVNPKSCIEHITKLLRSIP